MDEDLMDELIADGYSVDEGSTIDGPFIPDGTVRILDEDGDIVAEGDSLQEAYEDLYGPLEDEPDIDESQEWESFDPYC